MCLESRSASAEPAAGKIYLESRAEGMERAAGKICPAEWVPIYYAFAYYHPEPHENTGDNKVRYYNFDSDLYFQDPSNAYTHFPNSPDYIYFHQNSMVGTRGHRYKVHVGRQARPESPGRPNLP